MAYLGNTPTSQAFLPGTDTFSGTGSQTAFTLSRNVSTVNDILVVVNNVEQQPSNYTVAGTTLTFSPAPSSGTNNIYVRYLSTNLLTIVPSQASVGLSQLSATGTPSSTTFHRGDNTWSTPVAASGSVVKIATTTTDGLLTTTTQGAPSTITNGVQVFSLSFTPTYSTSTILVQTSTIAVSEETNFADIGWLALWDGSTFIAATSGSPLYSRFSSAFNATFLSLNNSYSAGSTSARTITVRAGMNGGVGTVYVNGSSAANYSGSSARIQMTIWEIAP